MTNEIIAQASLGQKSFTKIHGVNTGKTMYMPVTMSQRGADFKRLGSTHFRHAVLQNENMFCLVLESRRPVLEQVELCVNSCV